MDDALIALDRGVRVLFPACAPHDSSAEDEPLCALCGCPRALPRDWLALRGAPVLARHVLSTWARCAAATATTSPTTTIKSPRKPTSIKAKRQQEQSSAVREQSVASITRVCVYLHKCALVTGEQASDLLDVLIDTMGWDLLPSVLRQRALAISVRMRLLTHAICRAQRLTRLGDPQIRRRVHASCLYLQQEWRDRGVNDDMAHREAVQRTHGSRSRKRSREMMVTQRGGDGNARGQACDGCEPLHAVTIDDRDELIAALETFLAVTLANVAVVVGDHREDPERMVDDVQRLITAVQAPNGMKRSSSSRSRVDRHLDFTKNNRTHYSLEMVQRSSHEDAVQWADCDRIVELLTQPQGDVPPVASGRRSWSAVWNKERSKRKAESSRGSLVDVVQICVIADMFTQRLSAREAYGEVSAPLIGYTVLRTVMQDSGIDVVTALKGVCEAASRYSYQSRAIPVPFLQYFQYLLQDEEEATARGATSTEPLNMKSKTPSKARQCDSLTTETRKRATRTARPPSLKGDDMIELVVFTHVMLMTASAGKTHTVTDREHLFSLWDRIVTVTAHLSMQDDTSGDQRGVWATWLSSLVHCRQAIYQRTTYRCVNDLLSRDFEAFVGVVVSELVLSNGARVGYLQRPQPSSSLAWRQNATDSKAVSSSLNDQGVILSLLSQVFAESSVTNTDWIADVIFQLCRRIGVFSSGRRCGGTTVETSVTWRGVQRLLLPSLWAYVQSFKGGGGSQSYLESIFQKVMTQVAARMRMILVVAASKQAMIVALTRFVYEWDSFYTSLDSGVSSDEMQGGVAGRRVLTAMNFLPDILTTFVDRSFFLAIPIRVLHFLEGFLQVMDSSSVGSAGANGLIVACRENIAMELMRRGHPGARDSTNLSCNPLISHTDHVVQRVLSVFHSRADSRCLLFVNALKADDKLQDLLLLLRRWIALLEVNGGSSELGDTPLMKKESREELILLYNRFKFWSPQEFDSFDISFRPVDAQLIEGFASHTSDRNVDGVSAAQSETSIVRLNLMMRSFLSLPEVPDLLSLTKVIMDAVISTRSSSTRDGLLKLMTLFAPCIVMEIVVRQLHQALTPAGCINAEPPSVVSTITNSFAIVAALPSVFNTRAPRVSIDLISMETVESWLAIWFRDVSASIDDQVTGQHKRRGGEQDDDLSSLPPFVNSLVNFVETLLAIDEPKFEKVQVLQHAYMLAAFLSTALIAVPYSLTPPAWQNVHHACHRLHAQLVLVDDQYDNSASSMEMSSPNESICVSVAGEDAGLRCALTRIALDHVSYGKWTDMSMPPAMLNSLQHKHGERSLKTPSSAALYLPFESWLRGALAYTAELANMDSLMYGSTMQKWEDMWMTYVVDFYLIVEYHGDTHALLVSWLKTWIRVSQEKYGSFVPLFRFQRDLFWHLCGAGADHEGVDANRSAHGAGLWTYVFECITATLDGCARVLESNHSDNTVTSAISSRSCAVKLVAEVMDTLDLVALNSFTCCVIADARTDVVKGIFDAIQKVTAHSSFVVFTAQERVAILAPALEIFINALVTMAGRTRENSPEWKHALNLASNIRELILEYVVTVPAEFGSASVRGTSFSPVMDDAANTEFQHLVARWRRRYRHMSSVHSEKVFAAMSVAPAETRQSKLTLTVKNER